MAEANPVITSAAEPEETTTQKPKRRWGKIVLMLAVPLVLLAGGLVYWLSLQGTVSTDNAYLQQDKVAVSAQVGGEIVEVFGNVVFNGEIFASFFIARC